MPISTCDAALSVGGGGCTEAKAATAAGRAASPKCASNDNAADDSSRRNQKHDNGSRLGNRLHLQLLHSICLCSILILTLSSRGFTAVQGAAVYSNSNFLANPNFEPMCSAQQEHFIESEGKESSLMLEFDPSVLIDDANGLKKSCTRILSTPSSYGFIVRLILPKLRRARSKDPSVREEKEELVVAASTLDKMATLIEKLNTTALKSAMGRSCPLSIFSSLDPHIPQWRLDPCQLEDTAPEMEDPVRLFHGRVRIVWEHNQHKLNSKLMVTVLGKGEQCRSENKHQCLKIGDEPILCISKDLVCDGIRHCPYSNEYDSDEDYAMCWKRRRFGEPIPPAMESDIFEHFALEVFRNLFAFDTAAANLPIGAEAATTHGAVPTSAMSPNALSPANSNSTTLRKVETKHMKVLNNSGNNNDTNSNGTSVETTTMKVDPLNEKGHHRRNSTRSGLSSDLSKYGPWGYLMLGMLLCGGALLICGLWASASQHAANNERESALQHSALSASQGSNGAPPNYEELDPPPAYSVLFPNQKASSTNTLNSLATTATPAAPSTAPTLTPVVAVAATSAASTAAGAIVAPPASPEPDATEAAITAEQSTPATPTRHNRNAPTLLITNAQ